jgi:histone deacetylase 6
MTVRSGHVTHVQNGAAVVATKGDKLQAQLMRYVWDNYVELSEAENVVFIGHGTACNSLMDLINTRGELSTLAASRANEQTSIAKSRPWCKWPGCTRWSA